MNAFAKVADGLAGWLTFELRCRRQALFREALLAHPLSQLLAAQFPGRVLTEVTHPVLAKLQLGPGRKKAVDFVVRAADGKPSAVVETKWASSSPTLLRDLLRDIVRLDLLVPSVAQEGLLVLAGVKRDLDRLFASPAFLPHPAHLGSKTLLPVGSHGKFSVRFHPASAFRRRFFGRVLQPFADIPVSSSIVIERSGPFPRDANLEHGEVYIWRLRKRDAPTFLPGEYFD